jgi:outer membrane protein OmpA-like peptidoglycan-associated protein
MKTTITVVLAAGVMAACTSQPQRKITVTTPPPRVTSVAVQPAPQPPPATVVVPTTRTVTVVEKDENARREAAAAQARAAEAERQRQAEAERAAAAEARATEAERRAGDFEREIASITEVQRTDRGLVVTLSGDVLFEFDRVALLPPAQTKLSQLAAALQRTDAGVTIEGHTDSVGTDGYNRDLSHRRAQAVRDHLVAHGVPAERITVAGHGESRPLAENASAEGRAMNRRVEIVIATDQAP